MYMVSYKLDGEKVNMVIHDNGLFVSIPTYAPRKGLRSHMPTDY